VSLHGLQALVFATTIAVFVVGLTVGTRQMRREKERRFAGRPDLMPGEFYERFYASAGLPRDAVLRTIHDVALELEVPEAKLRPEDRFAEDLRPVRGWEFDDGIGILSWELDRLARKAGVAIDLGSIATLDDYIRYRVGLEATMADYRA
jgi:hypothetical protein